MRTSPDSPLAEPTRWTALDLARGGAVLAMFVYHFSWDLQYFRLIEADVVGDPAWRWFARLIAGSFLFLVGVSLVLAHGRGIRWRAFLQRAAIIGMAAVIVTAMTRVAMPEGTIWFGILHCITVSSLIALPFLRLPALLTILAAMGAFAAPLFLQADMFNAPVFYPLGLRTVDPSTNDYVPILPWSGCVLLGVAAARLNQGWLVARRRGPAPPLGRIGISVAFLGRHSLPIYLVHQPVFIGALWLLTALTSLSATDQQVQEFRDGCRAQCSLAGTSRAVCDAYCTCAEEELTRAGLWRDAIANRLAPATDDVVAHIIGLCRRQSGVSAPGANQTPRP